MTMYRKITQMVNPRYTDKNTGRPENKHFTGQYNIVRRAILAKLTFWKYYFSKSESAYISALFHKKIILKEWITFTKLRQNTVCTHEFSWFTKKVVCTTYVVLGSFGSPAKWQKCTYDYIALTWRFMIQCGMWPIAVAHYLCPRLHTRLNVVPN